MSTPTKDATSGWVFFAGILILALSIGTLAPHQAWGWAFLGIGLIVMSMLSYLGPN